MYDCTEQLSLRQKGAMKRKLWRRKRNNLTGSHHLHLLYYALYYALVIEMRIPTAGELSWVKEVPQESLWKKYFSPAKSDHKVRVPHTCTNIMKCV